MKKKCLIIFNFIMTAIVFAGLILGTNVSSHRTGLINSKKLASTVDRSFELNANPDYQKRKAGETAEIVLDLKNINMGEIGLNNIVGYLSYDESLFDEVNIEGVNDWHFEQNTDKNHEMYGKFVVYTMQEGVKEGQDIVKISLKLKSDLKPQLTEVKLTNIKSSDGIVSVDEDDKTATIEIYEEGEPEPGPEPTPEPTPTPDSETTEPELPEKNIPEVHEADPISIKTGDNIIFISIVLALATIMLNVMIALKKKDEVANNNTKSKVVKAGINTSALVIAIGLLLLAVTSFAHNTEITELINRLDYKESWLNSEKYLVTDETVSRIAPLTNVNEITDKFNKEIKVYEKESDDQVTDGIVKTGMRISDNEYNYNAVVLGDINGDGESDHIELTRIIRNIVNHNVYKFNDIEKLAADMNVDNSMNMDDVNTSIRYILYGELNIPGFDQVIEPKIEVVGGTFNNTIDAYEDTITVKISEQDPNATKTKYKIEGTSTKDYTEIESGDTFQITNNGVYKVSAYSYGALGNRSEIPYTILVKKNPNNNYKVTIRTENVDGTYDEETEEHTGRIGTTVRFEDNIPDGFQINEEQSTLEGVIDEEEKIELIVTLDRKEYTLKLNTSEYISSVAIGEESNETTISKTFKFGKTVNISADVKEREGYTTTFNRWKSENESFSDIGNKEVSFEMPKYDVELSAIANRVNNTDTKYKVEYYYEHDGIYDLTASSSIEKNGETDATISVDEDDKRPTRQGYVLDESKQDDFTGVIAGDGSLVLKVYFKQEFTVTYSKGTHGTFDSQVTEHLSYNSLTPEFQGELTHHEGYIFAGWDKTPDLKVTENIEYVATWTEDEYTITYDLHGGTLGTDTEGKPITNPGTYKIITETFTLHNPTKNGYRFKGWTGTGLNTEKEQVTIEQGSTGNRTYEANWEVIDYGITYNLKGGTLGFDDEGHAITNPIKYNVETPSFELNNPKLTGYTFLGWTGTELDEETTQVVIQSGSTGDRFYTANWRPNTGVAYRVRYYLENIDSNDSSDRDNFEMVSEKEYSGVTDEEVRAPIIRFPGFTFDNNNQNNHLVGNIAGDGSLVLEVFYIRDSYTITLEKDENIESVTGAGTYKFDQDVNINAILKTQTGYTIEFIKWKSSTADSDGDNHLDDQFEENASFKMPAGDVTLTAMSNKTANRVNYTVEFYYEENGEYPDRVTDEYKVVRQAETDTTANITDEDKTPIKTGYIFDESRNGDLSGIVSGDGSLVLKVFFKQEFTVTYSKGTHGTFESQVTEHLAYNSDTPTFVGEKTHELGYEFTSWDKTVDSKVTKSVEYVAEWKATEYTIAYELNGGTLGTDTEGQPITNKEKYTVETQTFTLHNPTREGYTFDGWIGTDLTEQTEVVTINQGSTGNRSYEAKWKPIEYTITYELNGGTLGTDTEGRPITNKEKYTIETRTFTLNNPTKVGYRFLGWTGTELDSAQTQVTIEQGSTGNRNYEANWQENTGVVYHVNYYLEKLNSTDKNNPANYTLKETAELDGTTNQYVEAEIKSYTGFTFDNTNPNNVVSGNIAGDGSLVLEVYYTRNSYTLTIQKDEYIDTVSGKSHDTTIGNSVDQTTFIGTFKYEEVVDIKATSKNEEGYTITFKEWQTESTGIYENEDDKKLAETSITMPADNVIIKATSEREANTVDYRVEFYYEDQNGYQDVPTYTDTRSNKVGIEVNVTENDMVPNQDKVGYIFDENADNVLSVTIPTSGTAVLKVYFKKNMYVLRIVAGDKVSQIKLGDETAGENGALQGTYYYGDSITIDASVGTEEGYTIDFGKWKSSNTSLMADNNIKNLTFTMPAGDITLTAIADIIPLDANYTVEYYYQVNGEYPDDPGENNKVTRSGKTGQQASITGADKEPITTGYIYDTSADNIETTDERGIRADGSTVLKVHFKQQFTVTYNAGEHANFDSLVIRNRDYGSQIPEYTGSTEGKDGYIFDSWKLTKIGDEIVTEETVIPSTVINNLEYTAQWIIMPVPTVTHIPTEWTNENVTATITAPQGFEDYDIEYSIDDSSEWRKYSEPFEIEKNCMIHARISIGDNKGEAVDHPVTNIDKIRPEFEDEPTVEIVDNTAVISVIATDNLSGIVEYGIKEESYSGFITYTCDNTLEKELSFSDVHSSGEYQIFVRDAARNINETTVHVDVPIHNVARIVEAPAGYENLIGTEYETLELALSTSDDAAQIGNVKIEIIDYIDNEENTIPNGREYTINLNNYYVKSQEGGKTLTVEGKLTLLDENNMGEGKVESTYGVGIYIPLGGELTLGIDEGGIPSIFSPIVEGKSFGIQKEIDYDAERIYDEKTDKYYYPEGVLNFYDGKVIGGTAAFMLQRVNDTPALYDPTVITNPDNGNQESTLAIVSNIEAVIGKKRYMLLEDAVADANNVIGDSSTQVEITIVRDILKDENHKVLVDETKNIKLDLNGHTFSTTTDDYALENYGKLEIYDSSKQDLISCYSIEAESTNIVSGTIRTNDGRVVIDSSRDLNFDFTVEDAGRYTINVAAKNLNRAADVYIDGRKVFDLKDCVSDSSWCDIDIDLGVLTEGNHNIRFYSNGSNGPLYDKFEVKKGSHGLGKITSSTADTIFNGISENAKQNIQYEDIDLTQAVANGDYYFESRAEGGLISNNGRIANTARSYIEIDLSDKEGMYEVVVDSIISSRKNYDYGYVTVKNNTISPDYNTTFGRKIYLSGTTTEDESKFNLAGGEKYYIHFGYRKASSSSSNSDCYIIRSMKIGKIEDAGRLTIQSGIYENLKVGTSNVDTGYVAVIKNQSILTVNDCNMNSTQNYSDNIYNSWNSESGYVEINGGSFNAKSNNILNNHTGLFKINGGTFTNNQSNSAIYNRGFLYIEGEDVNVSGNQYNVSTADAGVTHIEAGTYSVSSNRIIRNISDLSRTYVTGGDFTGGSYGIINEGAGYVYVKDANINNTSYGIYNDSYGLIEVDSVYMTEVDSNGNAKSSYGIHNDSSGRVIVNGGNIVAKLKALQNEYTGYMEINDGTYRVTETGNAALRMGNYSSSSTATTVMNGGRIIGMSEAVSLYNKSTFTINGGILEHTQDDGGSIYTSGNYITVNVGNKENDVSTTNPDLRGQIRTKGGTFNFYDGVISGPVNDVIHGIICDMPDGYELVREVKEDGLEYITLGIPTYYVARIAESENPDLSNIDSRYYTLDNGYYKFVTLKSAIEACNETNQTTIELLESEMISRPITINENQDIVVKMNNHDLMLVTSLDFENNGKIKFINEQEVGADDITYSEWQSYGGTLIKNNENATFDMENISITYKSNQGSSDNRIILIDNYGDLNGKNIKQYSYYDDYFIYVRNIYNRASGKIYFDNLQISGNGINPLINLGEDRKIGEDEVEYSATIKNSNITYSNRPDGVYNDGPGTLYIENSIVKTYSSNRNNSTGRFIVYNSTVTNTINNNDKGYIEINESNVRALNNEGTGKILVKGPTTQTTTIRNNKSAGIVEIQDGTIKSTDTVAISNTGELIITGGKIISTYNSSSYQGIQNKSSGRLSIRGANTTVNGYRGILNEGTAEIYEGKIQGDRSVGIVNSGTLTLGTKDGTVKYIPNVVGKTEGINNTGILNFYDGIIEGNETKSITGSIPTETEVDTLRVIHKGEMIYDDGTESGYNIPAAREISVLEKLDVAYLESNGLSYQSLNEAYANAEPTDTIKVIHDISISGTTPSLEIEEGKNITLDLNGFNIVAANNQTIINNGTFRITDKTSTTDPETGVITEGRFVNGANTILVNNGTATIDNGSYELTLGGSSTSNYYDMFVNNGTLNINNAGKYEVKGKYSRVLNNVSGTATIKNAEILAKASNSVAIINKDGIVTAQNATVQGSSNSVYNEETGTINLESGTYSGQVYNKNSGEINIYNGTYSSQVYNNAGGTINISGGSISGGNRAIENYAAGTINITGGTIQGRYITVDNNADGYINIDGTGLTSETPITIIGKNDNAAYGVYNNAAGQIDVKGHVYIDTATGNSSYNEMGIYNYSTGTVNVGDPDNITNDTVINSTNYAIFDYNNSVDTINYYGAKLEAPIAIAGHITSIADGYQIIRSVDGSNEVYEIGKPTGVAKIGNTEYDSLADAIEHAGNDKIELLKDIVIVKGQGAMINNNQIINLDLAGKVIKIHDRDTVFTNNGSFKITDSSEEETGKIGGYCATIVENYGTFELASGYIALNQLPKNKLVHNKGTGTVKISGGTLRHQAKSVSTTYYNIYDESDGREDTLNSIEITGGTIYSQPVRHTYYYEDDSTMYEVYCVNRQHVKMSGGLIYDYSSNDYTTHGIYMPVGGKVDLSGTAAMDIDYDVKMSAGGVINISDEYESRYGYTVHADYTKKDDLEVHVSGGTTKALYSNVRTDCKSSLEVTGGHCTETISYFNDVDIYSGSDVNVSGNALSYCNDVYIHPGATMTGKIYQATTVVIDDATVNGDIVEPRASITMDKGTINGSDFGIKLNAVAARADITGGTVNASAGPGILITKGILTLGTNESGVYPDTTNPSINGSTYGVQNSGGTFNFYDGILTGNTYATNGVVTDKPEMFSVIYKADGTIAILGIEATFEQVASVNGVYYDDLMSAVNAAIAANAEIELCKDITTATNITIPSGSSVTINLLGFSINGYTESGALFTNNGTLVIEDTSNDGYNESSVRNYTGVTIVNNGNLVIGTDDSNVYTNAPRIFGTEVAIENNGTWDFFDGQIGRTGETGAIIVNNGTARKPSGYTMGLIDGVYTLVQE